MNKLLHISNFINNSSLPSPPTLSKIYLSVHIYIFIKQSLSISDKYTKTEGTVITIFLSYTITKKIFLNESFQNSFIV